MNEFFNFNEKLKKFDLLKYSYLFEDNKNIIEVEDAIVCDKNDLEMFLEMFKLETNIETINEGNLSLKINDKYAIVFDSLKFQLKDIVTNFIFKIRNILKEEDFSIDRSEEFEYLNNVVRFLNFILLFSPEFPTAYNLKKKILLIIKTKYIKTTNEISELIFSEFSFMNLIHEKFRKCSISWEYRLFLIKNFYNVILSKNNSNYDQKIYSIINFFKNIPKTIKDNYFPKSIDNLKFKFLLLDIFYLEKINNKENRNYHLWKYIIHIFHIFYADVNNNLSELVIIFSFCLVIFLKNLKDYSAFSSLHNLFQKLKYNFTQTELKELKSYLIDLKIMLKDMDTKYLHTFIENNMN